MSSMLSAAAAPAYDDVALRLVLDAVAIVLLAYGIYYRRHHRREMLVVLVMFNVGLFVALQVIAGGNISVGIGFGLFAVLSILRLRSEQFDFDEMGYFFLALVLALVNGLQVGGVAFSLLLTAVALATAVLVDHPRIVRPARRLEVTLEVIFSDEDALRRHLEERLNARVTEVSVKEIDYVRETTRAVVHYTDQPRTRPLAQESLDAPFPDSPR
jgi:hypothetical protein